MGVWNVFRLLGDISHTLSKCILIWAIHSNKSAEGVSLITQGLYVLVFVTRYLDLFWVPPSVAWWNFVLKIFYICSSIYVIVLMMRVYPRTREREKAWKLGGACLGGALVAAPLVTLIFERSHTGLVKVLWSFSEVLESVCVLPQLLLLRQTTVPTVIDSFYLLALGTYRAFYILNWIARAADADDHPGPSHPIAIIFGVIQTALYCDFAWVYWSRQRVKLRGGGIVDSEDLSKGWLVSRIIGTKHVDHGDEEAPAADGADSRPKPAGRWGARGISVSADEGVVDVLSKKQASSTREPGTEDELAGILEEDDDDADGVLAAPGDVDAAVEGLDNGQEWRDGPAR
ncbi:MAG: hypothetical protein M1838_000170 [Thelocarpon superellum]|nr:MAG: hypothetical protein M1838_000170 [Thelocarpon superellum]